MGGFSQRLRNNAGREYLRQLDRRGVVVAVHPNTSGGTVPVLEIEWADGERSTGFANMVQVSEDEKKK
jgi:hypothetical protein